MKYPGIAFLAISVLLFAINLSLISVSRKVGAQTTAYLCVEAWKLRLSPAGCDKLLSSERSNQP